MNDRFFLDTNIFVYTFDSSTSEKRHCCFELVQKALSKQKGFISFQVIKEFTNVAIKKFVQPLSVPDIKQYTTDILFPLCTVYPNAELYNLTLDIHQRTHFSFYDSMIIAAAQNCNCSILYSEDLQHNFRINDLTIVNPFFEQN